MYGKMERKRSSNLFFIKASLLFNSLSIIVLALLINDLIDKNVSVLEYIAPVFKNYAETKLCEEKIESLKSEVDMCKNNSISIEYLVENDIARYRGINKNDIEFFNCKELVPIFYETKSKKDWKN